MKVGMRVGPRALSLALTCLAASGVAQTPSGSPAARLSPAQVRAGLAQREAAVRAERDAMVQWARRHRWPLSYAVPGGRAYLHGGRPKRPRYVMPAGTESALTTGAASLWPTGSSGLGLTGTGSVSAIFDFGQADALHPELAGRVVNVTASGVSAHATQIAGLISAIGVTTDFRARNSAPGSTVRVYDTTAPAIVAGDLEALGVSAGNHSYTYNAGWQWNPFADGYWMWMGDPTLSMAEDAAFGYYDSMAAYYDGAFLASPRTLQVVSAGNLRGIGPAPGTLHHAYDPDRGGYFLTDYVRERAGGTTGYDTLPPGPQTAKNGLVVGACHPIPNGYRLPTDIVPWTSSSIGPTDDGRIKPDLLAPGVGVWAIGPLGTYGAVEGTSFAAPQVVGASALLSERYRYEWGDNPTAALQKALFIHTAKPATADGSPTYATGWGMLDVREATEIVDAQLNGTPLFEEGGLDSGTTREIDVVSDGSGPIKVTLAWLDPAASPTPEEVDGPTRTLVNDLDVRVTYGSETHLPWVLNPAAPAAAATRGDNVRDNVEQVVIAAPLPGTYRVRISGKGTFESGHQGYALVVTGGRSVRASGLTISRPWVCGGDASALSATVTLNSPAPSGGATVRLTATGALGAPASVTIPAGSSSVTFALTHAAVGTNRNETLVARLGDGRSEATVDVQAFREEAEFVSQSVPDMMLAGTTATASITMRNTGNQIWTRALAYRMGSQSPQDNVTWGMNRLRLEPGEAIHPGQTKTFTFTITAPTTGANHPFAWRMVRDGWGWFGPTTPVRTIVVPWRANDSVFVSQTAPPIVARSGSITFSVTFRNAGTQSWVQGQAFRLGSLNDSMIWGSPRVSMNPGEVVAPGEAKTFTFTRTAPAGPGTYVAQWRMVQDGVEWFGATSSAASVLVPDRTNDSRILSVSAPSTVAAGSTFTATVTVRNAGTATWSLLTLHRLGDDTRRWGRARWNLDLADLIATGATKTFTTTFTAPTTPGTYPFQWRMVQDGVEWFGESTSGTTIVVN